MVHVACPCGGKSHDHESMTAHLILLPVLKRIHWGIGLFCLAFLARTVLILKLFWDGCKQQKRLSE